MCGSRDNISAIEYMWTKGEPMPRINTEFFSTPQPRKIEAYCCVCGKQATEYESTKCGACGAMGKWNPRKP